MLVDRYMAGELPADHFITHRFAGVESTNQAVLAAAAGAAKLRRTLSLLALHEAEE